MTDASSISAIGVVASLLLVAVAVLLSWWQRLGLVRVTVWSAARALVQLVVVGFALDLVVDPARSIWWSWLWVVLMLAFAATTVRRRAPEVPGAFPLALTAFAAAAVVGLGVLFGFGVFPVEGRTVVPLAGLLVGNSMTATILVSRRLVDDARARRDELEARLALGMSVSDAARPLVRESLRTALIPQIETTKAVGLVFLPGAMTGLVLAGTRPLDAVLVQVAIMYLVLGAVTVTTTVVALGLRHRLFTRDARLAVLPPKPAG